MPITTSFEIHTFWAPGPTRYENGDVVMTAPPKSERQNTLNGRTPDGADVELARIHEPGDAVAFVSKFGPLEVQWLLDVEEGAELREPFNHYAETAKELREALWLMKNVRLAMPRNRRVKHGDRKAVAELRDWAMRTWSPPATLKQEIIAKLIDTNAFLPHVTHKVVEMLNGRTFGHMSMEAAGPSIPRDPRESPDRLRPIIHAHNLRAYCYAQTFIKLMSRAPILTCPTCTHDFVREGNRFCSRNCARRARYKAAKNPTLPPQTPVAVGA
jgi:hypothetical protein